VSVLLSPPEYSDPRHEFPPPSRASRLFLDRDVFHSPVRSPGFVPFPPFGVVPFLVVLFASGDSPTGSVSLRFPSLLPREGFPQSWRKEGFLVFVAFLRVTVVLMITIADPLFGVSR